MIHKNWAELIKPTQLDVKPGNDPMRQATELLTAPRLALSTCISVRLKPPWTYINSFSIESRSC